MDITTLKLQHDKLTEQMEKLSRVIDLRIMKLDGKNKTIIRDLFVDFNDGIVKLCEIKQQIKLAIKSQRGEIKLLTHQEVMQ